MAKTKTRPKLQSASSREAHWRAVYDDWERSGLTQKHFCGRRGHSFWTFLHWRTKLRKEERARRKPLAPKTPNHPGFAEVRVIPSTSSSWPVEIGLPDGITVRLARNVEPVTLEMALRFVEGRRTC